MNATTNATNLWALAWQGIRFHRWMLIPVSLGVAVATAVILGALLVGDSVRGSLHYLATDRLGDFDSIMLAPRFFDRKVIDDWKQPSSIGGDTKPLPMITFPKATIAFTSTQDKTERTKRQAGNAMILGITPDYWSYGEPLLKEPIKADEIVVNEALAEELDVREGDKLTVRLPSQSAVPADNPLGRRESDTVNLPGLKVVKIIPNRSIGRFDLRSNQRPAMNAFVSIEAVQNALDRPGEINSIFFGRPRGISTTGDIVQPNTDGGEPNLAELPVRLSDLGFNIEHIVRRFPDTELGESDSSNTPKIIYDYYQLTSEQMLIPQSVVGAIQKKWPAPETSPILTYLANGIEVTSLERKPGEESREDARPLSEKTGRGEEKEGSNLSIPYSTIAAVDPKLLTAPSVGFDEPSLNKIESWSDDEVLVNQWLADQLKLQSGDKLKIDYFLPETVDGSEVEKSFVAQVEAVVPFTEPEVGYRRSRPSRFKLTPTPFNDSALTPEVPGITDQASISDWDLPFALTRTIRKEDDDYWTNHRLSPKLFLTLNKAQELFGSRFGKVSSIRFSASSVASEAKLSEEILAEIKPLMSELGWVMMPIRSQQLAAAKGTTPFDALFLSLSFFVILAALMLVALLFRLAIERRAGHWGTLLAIGWPVARLRQLLIVEGLSLALIGGLIGVPLGIGYAAGILALLRSWWIGAVGAPFIRFYMTPTSLIIGGLIGILAALVTIRISLRSITKLPTIQLMRGRTEPAATRLRTHGRWGNFFVILLLMATMLVTIIGFFSSGQAAGGAFVGAGMLALATMLGKAWIVLKGARSSGARQLASKSLVSFASTTIARQPLRSVLTIGLMSVATLLILTMGLFEVSPSVQGTGGFQWLVESSSPIAKSLNDQNYLVQSLGAKASLLNDSVIVPLRIRDGDDAGCNNLYQASQPKVWGISTRLADFEESQPAGQTFAWAAREKNVDALSKSSAWRLLEKPADGTVESPLPVIVDQNTAMWALHLTGGIGQTFHYEMEGRELHFKMVGQLQNTIMQGSLMIGEENFKRVFPSISGYRSWLVHVPSADRVSEVGKILENGWSDEGMDAVDSSFVLQNLLAVQNTYLKAFQSLGALGLLLGSIGLAVVQMRSVMERRSELGLLRAIGFTRERVGRLVLIESLTLLFAGLGIGCIAAGTALLPAIASMGAQPSYTVPLMMIGIVSAAGAIASFAAVRLAIRLNLIESIRQG